MLCDVLFKFVDKVGKFAGLKVVEGQTTPKPPAPFGTTPDLNLKVMTSRLKILTFYVNVKIFKVH